MEGTRRLGGGLNMEVNAAVLTLVVWLNGTLVLAEQDRRLQRSIVPPAGGPRPVAASAWSS